MEECSPVLETLWTLLRNSKDITRRGSRLCLLRGVSEAPCQMLFSQVESSRLESHSRLREGQRLGALTSWLAPEQQDIVSMTWKCYPTLTSMLAGFGDCGFSM